MWLISPSESMHRRRIERQKGAACSAPEVGVIRSQRLRAACQLQRWLLSAWHVEPPGALATAGPRGWKAAARQEASLAG
ncbi:hypothetical protein AV530_015090 [Patagioenas fasciata monilis]|uniref:Uncharacterized protein n=1 Tax=Patagioenas fasciata monilis TaxID=372326 RepID=A0A1V4K0W3_PATFA|nr:hypothetical protein AV530_015090 [Patagioenas fasciata monilis]